MNNNSTNSFPNGKYGPFGYNDNNNARQRVPSNMFPQNGGMPGNPFGRFNPLSTNSQNLMKNLPSMNNFDNSFQQNTPIIEKHDYNNYNELVHNNIGANVLDEHIVEYDINIDSVDRDITAYPDPFKFTVKFNPPARSIIQTEIPIDSKDKSKGTTIEKTLIKGPPRPHICKEFRNVKFIKLNNIVLPQHTKIISKDEHHKDKHHKDENSLINDRFVILKIKELNDDKGIRTYDTGDGSVRYDSSGKSFSYPKPFSIIYCNKIIGDTFYTGYTGNPGKIYNNSNLGNIKQLTFEFFDSCGIPIKAKDLITINEINKCDDNKEPIPITDPGHPLNKKLQIHLSFTIGVVEGQINTNTKLEH